MQEASLTGSTHREEFDDEEMEPAEREKMEDELVAIAKASEKYLEKNGGPSSSVTVSGGPAAGTQSASTKGLSSEITREPVTTDEGATSSPSKDRSTGITDKTGSHSQNQAQNQAQGIDLSFLDDLEAQVMDVLDDTISFDPSKVAPPPEPEKKPVVKTTPPPPPKRKSTDETDSVFVPMSPSKSKTLPHKKKMSGDSSPFEIRTRKTSDSSSDSYRRNTLGASPLRRKLNSSNRYASHMTC